MVQNPSLLAGLFTRSFVDKMIKNQHVPYLQIVFKQTNFEQYLKGNITVKSALLKVFNYLNDNYRCEYVFKSAILNEILLKRHSLKDAIYLTEFRAFNVKADILVLNGTSTVYEIKSDIDRLDRLVNQVEVYQKIFDKVFVVSNFDNLKTIKNIVSKNVGILILDKYELQTEREAKSNIKTLDKGLMFDSLRKPEYLSIIKREFGFTPNVPGTLIHTVCREMFNKMPSPKAHEHFLNILKQRQLSDHQIGLISNVNKSLKGVLSEKFYCYDDCKIIKFALDHKLIC